MKNPDHFDRKVTQAQVYRLARRIPDLPIPNQPKGIANLYDIRS